MRFSEFARKWWFALILGIAYIAVFNYWRVADREWTVGSSVVVSFTLLTLCGIAARRQYFLNLWDALLHLSVILDILLEGTLIHEHQRRGFYLCALGFAVVIVGYRVWLRTRRPGTNGPQVQPLG